jgi:hypothetical protein
MVHPHRTIRRKRYGTLARTRGHDPRLECALHAYSRAGEAERDPDRAVLAGAVLDVRHIGRHSDISSTAM